MLRTPLAPDDSDAIVALGKSVIAIGGYLQRIRAGADGATPSIDATMCFDWTGVCSQLAEYKSNIEA